MKAILVLDNMPSNCEECQFAKYGFFDICQLTGYETGGCDSRDFRCPLKPMPKVTSKFLWVNREYAQGWNDCLKEITGEND